MACRKCGSAWTTIKGADRASCPECCKNSRFWARQRGLIDGDSPQQKECNHCGESFQATTPSEKAKSKYCSDECRKKARSLWSREYRRAVSAGDRAPKTMEGRVIAACLACGNKLGKGQKKYCSNACFVKARSDGIQEWDRSAIDEAARKRPSNVCESPEAYATRAGMKDRQAFLRNFERMRRRRLRKQAGPPVAIAAKTFAFFVRHIPKVLSCKLCGVQCIKPAYWRLPHCSWECARKDCIDAVCTCCTRPMKIHFIGGNVEARKAKPVCNRCVLKRHKKLCGDFRKRCGRFGVAYDPKVTRPAVFVRDRYRCHICKKKTLMKYVVRGGRAHPRSPTVDHHPYPLSAGIKGHEWDNVRCACLKCNVRKGAAWSGQRLLFR